MAITIAMINISHLSKSFNKQVVLENISLRIPRGEIVCLLGPSGSGKTTLIRLILGAIAPDKGEVRIADTPVPNRQLLATIGFMPQQDALYDNLSAMDNLAFFAGLYGINKKLSGSVLKKHCDWWGLKMTNINWCSSFPEE